mmetsp:Transcript_123548/g.283313  ORF Transcript_123548/g.283313 Transcript_123548/m.283313 type:complete len:242 (+) Transcript_123548:815-1540(+)
MVRTQRAAFLGDMPFSVVAVTDTIRQLHANPDQGAHWRVLRQASQAWAKRDSAIVNCLLSEGELQWTLKTFQFDLCEDAPVIIMTDSIDARKGKYDRGPFSRLETAIIRHLSAAMQLPSLRIKTGFGGWHVADSNKAFSLLRSLDALHAGSPVMFLDIRERGAVSAKNREEMIEKGKKIFEQECEKLAAGRMCDELNTCAIAFFTMFFLETAAQLLPATVRIGKSLHRFTWLCSEGSDRCR